MSQEVTSVSEQPVADGEPARSPAGEGSAGTARPNRWVLQLAAAALAVSGASAVTFHYTARGIFSRAAAAAEAGGANVFPAARPDPTRDVVSLEHGLAVYAANCVACHGPTGLGDGPQAASLIPRPRNFSSGAFKIGSTRIGTPTDDDLAKSIRHGMLPAMMPPWPQLSDGEVKSLVMAVRHLAVEGRVAEKLQRDPAFPREKALAMAHAALDAGPVIDLPPKPPTIDLERGRVFYTTNCAACHDPDGRGKLRDDLLDNEENPITARDFTSGVFKGGDAVEDVAMRIVRGMPGSPMPTNPTITAEDLWGTAAYIKAFAKPTTLSGGDPAQTVGK
jgi:mono/diheme cytochrome c family protein